MLQQTCFRHPYQVACPNPPQLCLQLSKRVVYLVHHHRATRLLHRLQVLYSIHTQEVCQIEELYNQLQQILELKLGLHLVCLQHRLEVNQL